ncbi:piggyBac transposable element-derived protein 4-like [Bacillus rossius redtenbacheri]|uniref:piggyBac transposable element-derived protein 4-like n=1 Tax=Bacillus rossius redtenbacheri TaxID=93214 RepID=UPI002FDC9370
MASKKLTSEEALALYFSLPENASESEEDGDTSDEDEPFVPVATRNEAQQSPSSSSVCDPGTSTHTPQTRGFVQQQQKINESQERAITKSANRPTCRQTRGLQRKSDEMLDENLSRVSAGQVSSDSESSESDECVVQSNEEIWSQNVPQFYESLPDFSVPVQPRIQSLDLVECSSPGEFFCAIFDNELFEHLVSQTNTYAKQKQLVHWTPCCVEEMKAVFGVLLLMAVHVLPSLDHYWSSDPLFRVESICQTMTCKRFKKILEALHCNDNTKAKKRGEEGYDKLYKIRPVFSVLRSKFVALYTPSSCHSIDECMILFKGRSCMKQYMPLKPIKRGYKVWARCDPLTGFMSDFDFYTGKGTEVHEQALGSTLGSRVVTKLCSSLFGSQQPTLIVFDNFFTSVELLEILYQKNLSAVGTVRQNRRDLPPLLKKKNKLAKGEHVYSVKAFVCAIQWKDNRHVNILSSAHNPQDIVEVKRTQNDGTRTLVKCPKAVRDYTMYMRGVDRFDQIRATYTVSRRSRKWWHRIFYFLVDAALVNSFILYTLSGDRGQISCKHLDYHISVAKHLIGNFSSRKRKGPISANYLKKRFHKDGKPLGVPLETRFSNVGVHLPVELASFRRCRLCSSSKHEKRTRVGCSQCDVPLCSVPCFKTFHTK